MQIAVYVLYQRHEFAKASCFLTRVGPCLGPDARLWLLINDQDCPDIRKVAATISQHIQILCVGQNLGVAGGRNHLIRAAMDAGAEFLISCDTDILFEPHYFRGIAAAWQALRAKDPNVGLVQPLLLDGPKVSGCFEALNGVRDWSELQGRFSGDTSLYQPFWPRIRNVLGEDLALGAIMHSGVSNVWAAHFGASIGNDVDTPDLEAGFLETFRTRFPTLRSASGLLATVLAEGVPVRVGATAGGISAFHRSLYESVGGYDEIFNPFGFEDSEFGFRAQAAGFHHYLVPSITAIHDIFVSGQARSLLYAARIGLLRGVEAGGGGLTDTQRHFALRQSLFFGLRTLITSFQRHLSENPAEESAIKKLLPSALASYGFEFFRGLLHAAKRDGTSAFNGLTDLLAPGRQTLESVAIPLDQNVALVGRRVTKAGNLFNTGGGQFSLHAYDCHIQEIVGNEVLPSRYFDLSLHVRRRDERNDYMFAMDVLSDDILYKIDASFRIDFANAARDGILNIVDFECRTKVHDYGAFSNEDLYPSPRLSFSTTWLPMVLSQLRFAGDLDIRLGIKSPLAALVDYLQLGKDSQPEASSAKASMVVTPPPRRVLIFTDSRGQHKPRGCHHDVFAERMAKDPRLEVESYLCPMKWTTSLDFLMLFTPDQLARYDHVILYTGIVDWSPRKLSNAMEDLYDRTAAENLANLGLNTRDYSKKVINSKKAKFDEIFGADVMTRHFANPFGIVYEGERTINMYPLEDGVEQLGSRLAAIPNLIFINANRIVPGWRGDYPRERPTNMSIIHDYSSRFAAKFPSERIVDLMEWGDAEVQRYTCDNLHLTEAGSDWIYEKLMERLQMQPQAKSSSTAPASSPQSASSKTAAVSNTQIKWPEITFHPFAPVERMTPSEIAAVTNRVGRQGQTLATLIIGLRLVDNAPERLTNLRALLDWIDKHYADLFDVLLVEQDAQPRLKLSDLGAKSYVRHEFIFNDREFNRGWGYNVAVRHFCEDSVVVALMDTDVLTGPGFVSGVISCYENADVCSPYVNVYYSTAAEAQTILSTGTLEHLTNPANVKNPVTICGGIVIFRRSIFLALKGFEQYIGYSCEDRALDVTLLNHLDPNRIKILPEIYVHLFHPSDQASRVNVDQIITHLQENYSCRYHEEIKPFEFIHRLCHHASKEQTTALMIERAIDFGDLELYRSGAPLTVNGRRRRTAPLTHHTVGEVAGDLIFPPNFTNLSDYPEREVYPGSQPPDSEELTCFYNRYKGERCFIIGNGPSLNRHDLSLLEGEFSFGVNSFYYKTRETGFVPTFYVVEDSSVMKENVEEIRAFDAPFKFFPTIYRRFVPKTPNTFFFEMNRSFYEKSSPNYVVPRFSTDASKVLYCGQSVTYINLQLAFFMGFTEVHLIGMDFDYVIPESHRRTGDILLSDTDDPNHFHKDYFGKGKTWKDPKLDRVALNYRQAKLSYEAVGRRIYNTTIGGKLEVFDRVDYETLLRDPRTGGKRKERIFPGFSSRGSQEAAPTVAPIAHEGSAFLRNLASELLLDSANGFARLQDKELSTRVEMALATLPDEDPLLQHFQRVKAFVQSRGT